MHCNTCKTDLAARVRITVDPETKKMWEHCDICANVPSFWMPDTFLGGPGGRPMTDDNLCGKDGQPIPFSSKREKAAIMNMLGLRQADSAERQHGGRNESHLKRKKYFI